MDHGDAYDADCKTQFCGVGHVAGILVPPIHSPALCLSRLSSVSRCPGIVPRAWPAPSYEPPVSSPLTEGDDRLRRRGHDGATVEPQRRLDNWKTSDTPTWSKQLGCRQGDIFFSTSKHPPIPRHVAVRKSEGALAVHNAILAGRNLNTRFGPPSPGDLEWSP